MRNHGKIPVIKSAVLFVLFAIAVAAYYKPRAAAFEKLREINDGRVASKIINGCEGYRVRKTKSAVIYYTDGDERYAAAAEGLVKTYLPLLQSDFGLERELCATVVIFPSKREMYSAVGYTPQEKNGAKEYEPMGAYTAGILAVLSPDCYAGGGGTASDMEAFISAGPVVHELAHFVLDKKANGNYSEWFSEGAALYYENKYTGYEWSAPDSGARASYRELADGFKYLNETESYRKSYEIIKFIADSRGEGALKNIYGRLENGGSVESALRKELGGRFVALDGL